MRTDPIVSLCIFWMLIIILPFMFFALDWLSWKERSLRAEVISKQYEAPSTDVSVNVIGSMIIPMDDSTPERYVVEVIINGKREKISVLRSKYDLLKAGDTVKVEYREGRFTNGTRFPEIVD